MVEIYDKAGQSGGAALGGDNTWVLIPLLALLIPIVAILAGTVVKPWLAYRHRKLELEASLVAEKAAQYAAQTERLEQRVRVLERIVTDRGADLADEIDRLADSPKLNSGAAQ